MNRFEHDDALREYNRLLDENPDLYAEYQACRHVGWNPHSELGRFIAKLDRANRRAMRAAGI